MCSPTKHGVGVEDRVRRGPDNHATIIDIVREAFIPPEVSKIDDVAILPKDCLAFRYAQQRIDRAILREPSDETVRTDAACVTAVDSRKRT